MNEPQRSVDRVIAARQSRRLAVQVLATTVGGAILVGAFRTPPPSSALAQDGDDDDDSGHGRVRGRGGDDEHNGDDDAEDVAALTPAIPPGAIEIRIVSDDAGGFVPGELTVDLEQTVAFVNAHSDEHTATGSGFDTGIIPEGGVATVTLSEPGTFAYACLIHPEMTGRIAVRGADGVVPAPAAAAASPTTGAATVRIANLAFDPGTISVPPGGTVVWSNDDAVPHTVTALDGSFDSGIFDPGASFSWTFSDPGAFDYQCQLHPAMRGSVDVAGDAAITAPAPAAATSPATATGTQGETALPARIWIVDLIPGDSSLLAPRRALLSLHGDGLARADFAIVGAAAPTGILSGGHGTWRQEGNRLDVALIALLVDGDGLLRGTLTIHAEGEVGASGAGIDGAWMFSLAAPDGTIVNEGTGAWSGAAATLPH